jgi:hypothetical protein
MTDSNSLDASTPNDHRLSSRLALVGNATITATIGGDEFECVLIDFSPSGAKLRFREPPGAFNEITINHDSIGQLTGECIWQSAAFVGVRFTDTDRIRNSVPIHSCP